MSTPDPVSIRIGGKCPTCGRPTEARFRPFCSTRCQQLDLGRWLNESYRVPGPVLEDDEAEAFSQNGPARDSD